MTIVVGYPPEGRERAALNLAAMLARSADDDMVVCTVVPAPWFPSPARIDAEYQAYLDDVAHQALDRARADLSADASATFSMQRARSAPSGLLEVAEQHDATLIVLGSASAGVFGHIALGSVTDRLLHSSEYPLALATRGFRSAPGGRVTRVTVAYGGSEQADDLVLAAGRVAARTGATLRLASFAVRRPPPTTTRFDIEEDQVVAAWAASMRAAAQKVLEQVDGLQAGPDPLDLVIGQGQDWAEALEDVPWAAGDVLVVGSSSIGAVARVFLGSRATKIVRHSPVPVVVVPRAAAEELADR